MKLREYFEKDVQLIDIDGKCWSGYAMSYTPAIDSEEGIEEIGLMTQEQGLTSFSSNEIKSIKVILEN